MQKRKHNPLATAGFQKMAQMKRDNEMIKKYFALIEGESTWAGVDAPESVEYIALAEKMRLRTIADPEFKKKYQEAKACWKKP